MSLKQKHIRLPITKGLKSFVEISTLQTPQEKETVTNLHSKHERVVGVLQELNTELLEREANAECGASDEWNVFDGCPIAWLLALLFILVKGEILHLAWGLVVDETPVADGLHVGHYIGASEPRVPGLGRRQGDHVH